MLSLLAELFESFPETGDIDKPKLVMFIDEAHLIFNEASKQLLDQIEYTIKLIRSKGIGIYFVTQNPSDVPVKLLFVEKGVTKCSKISKAVANSFPYVGLVTVNCAKRF